MGFLALMFGVVLLCAIYMIVLVKAPASLRLVVSAGVLVLAINVTARWSAERERADIWIRAGRPLSPIFSWGHRYLKEGSTNKVDAMFIRLEGEHLFRDVFFGKTNYPDLFEIFVVSSDVEHGANDAESDGIDAGD